MGLRKAAVVRWQVDLESFRGYSHVAYRMVIQCTARVDTRIAY